jgi:hypothetical protein
MLLIRAGNGTGRWLSGKFRLRPAEEVALVIRSDVLSRCTNSAPSFWALVLVIAFTTLLAIPTADAKGVGKNLKEVGTTGLDLPTPPADKAVVVFFRPVRSGRVHTSLLDGDVFLSHLIDRTCFFYEAKPGRHLFSVVGEAADFLEADLAAGKTYFILVASRFGVWKPRFSLPPFTERSDKWSKRQKWLGASRVIVPTQTGLEWAEKRTSELAQKRARYFEKWQDKPEADKPRLRPEDSVDAI